MTINGGDGNDSIEGVKSTVKIDAGNGDDMIAAAGSKVTIDGGNGADFIIAGASNSSVNGGNGDDYIENSGSTVTVDSGDGNDYVHNWECQNVTINTGRGSDVVYNSSQSVRINTGDGNDSIENSAANVTILTGEGNDTILASGGTITSGAGTDVITARGTSTVTITDFNTQDALNVEYDAHFATFSNHLLNLDGRKIYLPNVNNINDLRNVIVTQNGQNAGTLDELLNNKAPYWTVSGTTATYHLGDTNGTVLCTITGLKSGLTAVNGAIKGITLDKTDVKRHISIAPEVLGQNTVSVSGDYLLTFAGSNEFDFEGSEILGWKVSGTTATLQVKPSSSGYRTSSDGKKIEYIKSGDTVNLAKISGLPAGTAVKADGSINGLTVDTDFVASIGISAAAFKNKSLKI